jgi:hypothetical protein
MVERKRKCIGAALLIVAVVGSSVAGDSYYFATSSTSARANGMGGAMTSIVDGLSSSFFNPACLAFYKLPQSRKMTLFLNPIAGFSALINRGETSAAADVRFTDWINYAGLFVKGVAYSDQSLTVAAILTEQLPDISSNDYKQFISTKGILDWNYSGLTARLRLANQLALGISGFLYTARGLKSDTMGGYSYGISVKPNEKFSIGLVYIDMPRKVTNIIFAQNRFVDETISIGFSYQLLSSLLLSLDFRNVSDEEGEAVREPHFGMEISPIPFFSIRAGYFRESESKTDVYSAGAGLLNSDIFRSMDDHFIFRDFVLNYGFQLRRELDDTDYRHYMTLLVRL